MAAPYSCLRDSKRMSPFLGWHWRQTVVPSLQLSCPDAHDGALLMRAHIVPRGVLRRVVYEVSGRQYPEAFRDLFDVGSAEHRLTTRCGESPGERTDADAAAWRYAEWARRAVRASPIVYASRVEAPVLLMVGRLDRRVSPTSTHIRSHHRFHSEWRGV